jgi:hypothetical protein
MVDGMKKLTVHKKKKEGPIVNHNVWVSVEICTIKLVSLTIEKQLTSKEFRPYLR